MASGLDFDERYLPGDDVTEMLYGGVPMWQVPLAQGHRVAPGQEFVYSSGDTNVVSYLWQASLEEKPTQTGLTGRSISGGTRQPVARARYQRCAGRF